MSNDKKIGKLPIELNPELVSICSKKKKLDVFAVWIALRTIDKHKQGTGKFTQTTCLDIIQEILKCNSNYSYEILKKGIGFFWNEPSGSKGSKIVYLFGIDKVVKTFSFELTKTQPFFIKVEDLFKHESNSELKAFLCSFVIGRYGQNKPITVKSLESNLGVSNSTVKRRIQSSDNLTVKKNFCQTELSFENLNDAYKHVQELNSKSKSLVKSYKIVKKDSKFYIVKQMGNSYSCEDFSRGKISKRPKSFRNIDAENKETLDSRRYYFTKTKKKSDNDEVLSKTKSNYSEFHLWNSVKSDEVSIPASTQIKRGRWRKNNKEC